MFHHLTLAAFARPRPCLRRIVNRAVPGGEPLPYPTKGGLLYIQRSKKGHRHQVNDWYPHQSDDDGYLWWRKLLVREHQDPRSPVIAAVSVVLPGEPYWLDQYEQCHVRVKVNRVDERYEDICGVVRLVREFVEIHNPLLLEVRDFDIYADAPVPTQQVYESVALDLRFCRKKDKKTGEVKVLFMKSEDNPTGSWCYLSPRQGKIKIYDKSRERRDAGEIVPSGMVWTRFEVGHKSERLKNLLNEGKPVTLRQLDRLLLPEVDPFKMIKWRRFRSIHPRMPAALDYDGLHARLPEAGMQQTYLDMKDMEKGRDRWLERVAAPFDLAERNRQSLRWFLAPIERRKLKSPRERWLRQHRRPA